PQQPGNFCRFNKHAALGCGDCSPTSSNEWNHERDERHERQESTLGGFSPRLRIGHVGDCDSKSKLCQARWNFVFFVSVVVPLPTPPEALMTSIQPRSAS